MSTSRQADAHADSASAVAIGPYLASRPWISALVLCLVIGVLARMSLAVLGPARVAPIWPANGVLLAVLLRVRPNRRPLMLAAGYLGVILGGAANGGALRSTVGLGACDVLEVTASVAIIVHFHQAEHRPIATPRCDGVRRRGPRLRHAERGGRGSGARLAGPAGSWTRHDHLDPGQRLGSDDWRAGDLDADRAGAA